MFMEIYCAPLTLICLSAEAVLTHADSALPVMTVGNKLLKACQENLLLGLWGQR